MKLIRNLILRASLLLFAATIVSCSYGAAVGIGSSTVVIIRNDSFLAGILRKVYVCKVTSNGLRNCSDGESP